MVKMDVEVVEVEVGVVEEVEVEVEVDVVEHVEMVHCGGCVGH